MRAEQINILLFYFSALFLCGCSEHEVLNSYEEIKEQREELVPLSFAPYICSNIEAEASTRADLNYMSTIFANGDYATSAFNYFPWYKDVNNYSKQIKISNSQDYYRKGTVESNSYIVGLYGYYSHNFDTNTAISWTGENGLANDPNLTSNFMTNQPLLHTAGKPNSGNAQYTDIWEYSPLKYWPNTTDNKAKVTFISYYPFQDFEGNEYHRDGTNGNADLTCITPPAPGAKGADAYTFIFEQHKEVGDHVDFLLGIKNDVTKQKVGDSTPLNLKLRHSLCAVAFDLRATKFVPDNANYQVEYVIKSVKLEGLYGKGKAYPVIDGNDFTIHWDVLGDNNTYYMLKFEDYAEYLNGGSSVNPFFDGSERRYRRQFFYHNSSNNSVGLSNLGYTYAGNSKGMKMLMLVIPQTVGKDGEGDAYLVINYDLKYTYNPNSENEVVNVFTNNEEKIKLQDDKKDKTTSQLFVAGKFLTFNIRFTGPKNIKMDAVVSNWDDIEEYEMSTDPVDDEDEGGGDQQGGDQQGGDSEPQGGGD